MADTRGGSIKDGMKGVQPAHNGIKGVLTSVYKEGGVRGLYRGAGMQTQDLPRQTLCMTIVIGYW